MAVSFHASATGTGTTTGSQTVTKPTVSAGDILVVVWGRNNGTTAGTVTAPAGWTRVGLTITSTKVRTDVWWAAQDVASTAFTVVADGSGGIGWSYVCASFSGVDTTTPIDATGTGNSNTGAASITPANYTSATAGALPLVGITDWNAGVYTSTGYTVKPSAVTNRA